VTSAVSGARASRTRAPPPAQAARRAAPGRRPAGAASQLRPGGRPPYGAAAAPAAAHTEAKKAGSVRAPHHQHAHWVQSERTRCSPTGSVTSTTSAEDRVKDQPWGPKA